MIEELFKIQDLNYKKFESKLLPNINSNTIIGVRIPEIRKIAKKYYNTKKYKDFMNSLPHTYLEENILHGCFISLNKDIDESINELNIFLPFVDNWSVCDTINPKIFKQDLNKIYKQIKKWIKSKDEYTVRFAIVTLLQFYLNENFKNEYNELVLNINRSEYYIKMAIAWYFSFALIKQYDKTIYIFENKLLDKWTHNKSIQKAIESFRVSNERKDYLRSLKIK